MSNKGVTGISGVTESRSALIISRIIRNNPGKTLILTAAQKQAENLASDLEFFLKKEVLVMPNEDQLFLNYETRGNSQQMKRLKGLKALMEDKHCVVAAPVSAAVRPMMPHSLLSEKTVRLEYGKDADLKQIAEDLRDLGYERMSMVEGRGEFSIRGGILDVFTPDAEEPYRIEFFDTEVDSIRTFDIDTQRSSGDKLKAVTIGAAQDLLADKEHFLKAAKKLSDAYTKQMEKLSQSAEFLEASHHLERRRDQLVEYIENVSNLQLLGNYLHYFYDDVEYLWDYMGEGTLIVDDPDRITEFLDTRSKEQKQDFQTMLERGQIAPEDMKMMTGREELLKGYRCRPLYVITPFPKQVKGIDEYSQVYDCHCRQVPEFNGRLELLADEIQAQLKNKVKVTIVCSTMERKKNLREFLQNKGLSSSVSFEDGILSSGMLFPEEKFCYISDQDIFGGRRTPRRRKRRRTKGEELQSFTDLKKGDYVVHENHGIGKFEGIEQLNLHGEKKDYLKIKYAGSDILYVPVEQFDIVQKYIGAEGSVPKMNKLSGTEWKTAKARAKKAIADMADELIKLYAEREVTKGYAFGPDTEWQKEFEESFPYVETDDQLRAIEEIKADMEKPVAMDRLLCGDVGFGKTEVAARAMFKCIADGKQAAMLVPTTLLANQHYYTLKSRFEKFPLKVEMLSRFRTEAEQKDIVKRLKEGDIDLIIGTHRLLSKDVKFKDLGLLVIDEEQRFGVKHKEKIKEMKKNVDVLTLSATPIPRTLNMSMTGIKDMSVITEPPEDRFPVQTYVMEMDDGVIREAIMREMDRGGQTFVIYNRVRGINQIAERIMKAVPEARVIVGHGQMSEQTLEDVMLNFVNHESDVLVATTIVESGIDVPNANTLIVLDADRYGLSQLYQLRGRVGRSSRMAYAYLMYQKDKVLTEVAEKRLRAVREFTEFGSGFKVAMRDLQIRGAGNLLGSEQSGHIMNIGYELYAKLVNDEVRRIKGESIAENPEETSVELAVSANIPDWYIQDEVLKIQMYKKIATVRTEEDEESMYDELVDRFGDVPKETMNLIKVSRIRWLAEGMAVTRIYEQGPYVLLSFDEKNPLNPMSIIHLNEVFGARVFVHGGVKPFIRIPLVRRHELEDVIRLLETLKDTPEGAPQIPGAADRKPAGH
ncbi:MAG: transcription-repair coupling factor [Eubacterium sp.]|jgi:transcription-repair coupling factor (superfamily II helicase)